MRSRTAAGRVDASMRDQSSGGGALGGTSVANGASLRSHASTAARKA